MVENQELEELQERKLALIAQSEVNRRILEAECENLSGAALWVERGFSLCKRTGPALLLVSPLLGIVAARRWRKIIPLALRVVSGWRVFRSIYGVWQRSRQEAGNHD